MTFTNSIKNPKRKKGQAVLEYFILFCVIGVLAIAGLTSFLGGVRTSSEAFFNKEANRIRNADARITVMTALDPLIAAFYVTGCN